MADKYGTKDMFAKALETEGVSGKLADIAWAIYGTESGGGGTKTSVSGARGGMQVMPNTFKGVADKGWDIDNPEHNARAGIRYLKQVHELADGDPGLTAVGYNGGPGAIAAAKQGKARSVPGHPGYGTTLDYRDNILARIGKGNTATKETPDVVKADSKVITPGLAKETPAPVVEKPVVVAEQPVTPVKEAPVQPVAVVAQAPVQKEAPVANPMEALKEAAPVTPEALQYVQPQQQEAPVNLMEALAGFGDGEAQAQAPTLNINQIAQMKNAQAMQQIAQAAKLGEGLDSPITQVAGTNDQIAQLKYDSRPMEMFNQIRAQQQAEAMNYG